MIASHYSDVIFERGYDILTPASTAPTPTDVPFLNVVDPAFDFTAPEVMLAQAKSWYAESPIGLLVLRYAEAQDLLRTADWTTTAGATWR